MKVAIHQPHYLPWLGYLAKMDAADCFVFLDTVQYEKNGWQNRNKMRATRSASASGWQWLTVPVRARLGTIIREVAIDAAQPWARKHCQSIRLNYARAAYFDRYFPVLEELLSRPWQKLADLNVEVTRFLASAFGISTRTVLASELAVTSSDPTERLLGLCLALGADTYLAGRDGAVYMTLGPFREAGVSVLVQDYEHPVYPQSDGEFLPFLSAVDLLLTHGESGLEILRRGSRWIPLVAAEGAR